MGQRDRFGNRVGEFDPLLAAARKGASLDSQRVLLVDGLRAHGVSAEGIPAIMEHVRDGIVLLPDHDTVPRPHVSGTLGRLADDSSRHSRVVVNPALPPGADWPRDPEGEPLGFIAALHLDELPTLEPLPESGVLLVFWSHQFGMDLLAATRVLWFADATALMPVEDARTRLERLVGVRMPVLDREALWATEEALSAAEYDLRVREARARLVGLRMPVLGELGPVDVTDADREALWAAQYDLQVRAYGRHQLLGASRPIQGPVLNEIAYRFDKGFPESRERFTADELAGEGWVLLAQFHEDSHLTFGDGGALYLVMPEADLAARRFGRVMGIMNCA